MDCIYKNWEARLDTVSKQLCSCATYNVLMNVLLWFSSSVYSDIDAGRLITLFCMVGSHLKKESISQHTYTVMCTYSNIQYACVKLKHTQVLLCIHKYYLNIHTSISRIIIHQLTTVNNEWYTCMLWKQTHTTLYSVTNVHTVVLLFRQNL